MNQFIKRCDLAKRDLLKNKKGETILETIIAMGVLMIGITLASTIIGSSLRNINASKNRIIAINIAREGIEAVRNIRDTNWLKFSSKRRLCWNNNPPQNPITGCDGSNPIQPGNYIIYKQEGTYRWLLGPLQSITIPERIEEPPQPPNTDGEMYRNTIKNKTYRWNLNQSKWEDITVLYLVDINPNVDSDGDGGQTPPPASLINDADIYNHARNEAGDDLGISPQKTVFKRFITIDYLTNDGQLISETTPPIPYDRPHNRMRVTATVSWREPSREFSTQLATHLTDYLGRENLTN